MDQVKWMLGLVAKTWRLSKQEIGRERERVGKREQEKVSVSLCGKKRERKKQEESKQHICDKYFLGYSLLLYKKN